MSFQFIAFYKRPRTRSFILEEADRLNQSIFTITEVPEKSVLEGRTGSCSCSFLRILLLSITWHTAGVNTAPMRASTE